MATDAMMITYETNNMPSTHMIYVTSVMLFFSAFTVCTVVADAYSNSS